MKSRTSNENLSGVSGLIAIPLAALVTFVVGYTVSRAHFSQAQDRNTATKDTNVVIPHEATLWSDLGGQF